MLHQPTTPKAPRKAPKKSSSSNPRYVWLHDCLLKDIQSGKYPVGSNLPTEEQLASTYKVSRHTVREATRRLADTGLIRRRRSTGTVVTGTHPSDKSYVAALGSMEELMQYTMSTQLDVFGQHLIRAQGKLSKALGCEPLSEWIMLTTYRKVLGDPEPISYTEVYLRPEFADIAKHLTGRHPSILDLHTQLFDQPVHSVVQRIEAENMPRQVSDALGLKNSPVALKLIRLYEDQHGRVMSASLNFYIPERFELVTRWSRTE